MKLRIESLGFTQAEVPMDSTSAFELKEENKKIAHIKVHIRGLVCHNQSFWKRFIFLCIRKMKVPSKKVLAVMSWRYLK